MPDDPNPQDNPQDDPNQDDPNQDDPQGDDEVTQLRKELDETRKELEKARKRKPRAKKKEESANTDEEQDKHLREFEQTREELRKLQFRLRVTKAESIAVEKNAIDGEAIARLIDWDSLEDQDSDEEIADAIDEILERKPALRKRTRSDAGRRGSGEGKTQSMSDLIRMHTGRE